MFFKEALNTEAGEIKDYISVNVSVNFDTIKPWIEIAEREYIKTLIGDDLYATLLAYYTAGTTSNSYYNNAIKYIQKALINLAYWRGFSLLIVKMGDQGAYRVENDKQKSLYKYQEIALKESFNKEGFNGLDYLLQYLEDNIDEFTDFKSSDNYTVFKGSFINTTKQFDDLYWIGQSRLVFLKLKRFMTRVEDFQVLPLLGRDYFDELKSQIKANTLSAANDAVVDIICKAVAPLSVAEGIHELSVNVTDKGLFFETRTNQYNDYEKQQVVLNEGLNGMLSNARLTGEKYLGYLKDYLHNNIDDYATYAASDEYDDTNTAHIRDNDSKKTFWA
jgi:hypothetical protein